MCVTFTAGNFHRSLSSYKSCDYDHITQQLNERKTEVKSASKGCGGKSEFTKLLIKSHVKINLREEIAPFEFVLVILGGALWNNL